MQQQHAPPPTTSETTRASPASTNRQVSQKGIDLAKLRAGEIITRQHLREFLVGDDFLRAHGTENCDEDVHAALKVFHNLLVDRLRVRVEA